MKKVLTFLFFYFWAVILSGQSSTEKLDNEKIVEAKIAFDKYSDCPAAKSALDQVSSKGKESMLFLLYASQVYECLKDYENAIESYEKLNKLKGDSMVDEKIIELRYLLNKKKVEQRDLLNKKISECKKCEGTGFYSMSFTCPNCDGRGFLYDCNIKCSRLNGDDIVSTCRNCKGKGSYRVGLFDPKDTCNNCNGSGKATHDCVYCKNGCGRGDCDKCSNRGEIRIQEKCNHE